MTMSFDALKKNRSSSLDKLNSQLSSIATKSYSDPNEGKFWKPTRDKAGNGFAIIRFLPPTSGEEMPFTRIWDHGFQGPTGLWYIENSLTTIGKDDPVSEFNGKLWNSGVDADKEQARKQKRRLKYISNILVIKDSGNPDNPNTAEDESLNILDTETDIMSAIDILTPGQGYSRGRVRGLISSEKIDIRKRINRELKTTI